VERGRLDSLRAAHGIDSDADLARVIGVDPATLYRVREGKTVASNEFLAKVAIAFPGASLDHLFTVIPSI
jgi:transcriptional regulator with XRE-family HTH domain